MTVFYLARHGETENNKKRLLSGWVDTPLTEQGKADALSAATKLEGVQFNVVVSSALGRANATAMIIARQLGYQGTIHKYQDLNEINYGEYGNTPIADYPPMTALENASFIPPNGESLEQMQRRVINCIDEVAGAFSGKTILIVAHDGTINAVQASFLDENIGIVDGRSRNPHDQVVRFGYQNGQIVSFEIIRTK